MQLTETKRLTNKQLKFIQFHYIDGKNITESVKLAGYTNNDASATTIGCNLQKNKYIKEYVAKMTRSTDNVYTSIGQQHVLIDDYQWKINKLRLVVNRSIPDDIGNIDAKCLRAGEGLAAIAELNKMQGHYAPTKSVNVDIKADTDIKRLLEISNKLLIEYNNSNDDKM